MARNVELPPSESPKPVSGGATAVLNELSASLGKPIHIPASEEPKRVTREEIRAKRYHVGCTHDAPFNVMYVAHYEFPKISAVRLPSAEKGQQGNVIESLGCEVALTEEQLKRICAWAKTHGWRPIRKQDSDGERSARWKSLDFTAATPTQAQTVPPAPPPAPPDQYMHGDYLTAHFIYIVELADGETMPVGTRDLKTGEWLPTPPTLMKRNAA